MSAVLTAKDLNEKRLGLIAKQRDLNNKAIAEDRDFTPEEKQEYDRMDVDVDRYKAQADRFTAQAAAEKELSQPMRQGMRPEFTASGAQGGLVRINQGEKYTTAFEALLREGQARMPNDFRMTLVKQTGSQGGYLAPVEYETTIRKKAYPLVLMRKFASVQESSSDSVIPMEGNLPTFGWIDELGTYPETDLTVGQASMSAYKMGGVIRASEEILQDAFTNLPDYISDRSKVSIAQTEDASFFLGDGNKKPRGVTLDATLGLTTAATTTFSGDDVLDFVDALPDAYQAQAVIIATKAWRAKVRKMKDTTGQYLWQAGLQAGAPDLLAGKELHTTPYLGALTAGSTVAICGDLSFYQILDRLGFYLQQLNETYALQGQVGFKIHERLDGKLLNPAAVVKMVMAAA